MVTIYFLSILSLMILLSACNQSTESKKTCFNIRSPAVVTNIDTHETDFHHGEGK